MGAETKFIKYTDSLNREVYVNVAMIAEAVFDGESKTLEITLRNGDAKTVKLKGAEAIQASTALDGISSRTTSP